MRLKMFVFDEYEDVVTWVAAENNGQAVAIFENATGLSVVEDDITVRETSPEEEMTYYHDGEDPDKDSMQNLIDKYCTKPDMFACSEF